MEQPSQGKTCKNISKVKHIFEFVIKVRWFISALIALGFFFLLKRFVVDIIRVNNHDMGSNFSKGDALLIKKSFNHFDLHDVVYFEYPVEDSSLTHTFFIQRVCGLPGDTVEMHDKHLYINSVLIADDENLRHNYFIKTKQAKLDSVFKLKYGLSEGGEISIDFDYSYSLTKAESEALKKDSLIKSVELKTEKENNFDETCYPSDVNFKWNMDHYGKLYIPKKNDTLRLDSLCLKLYLPLLTSYEKNELIQKGDSIFIDGQLSTFYVVKKNYYFVLGDNRDNANDSRVWGLLPESHIKGKVISRLRKVK